MVAVEEEAALSVAAVVVDVAVANGLVAIEHADSVPVVVAAASAIAHAAGWVLVSAASGAKPDVPEGKHTWQINTLDVSTFGGGAGHTGVGAAGVGAAAGLFMRL